MNRQRHRLLATVLAGGGVSTYTISGTVYDADGTTAVASATVALGAKTATSGADGTYSITEVPAGTTGSMTCTKTGYSWTAITISAMSGNLTSQNYVNAWWAVGGIASLVAGAYNAIGAASLAASYVNLANPGTNNASPGVAGPTLGVSGWAFAAASSQYLTTGIVPKIGSFTFVRFTSTATGGTPQCVFGGNSGNRYYLRVYESVASHRWGYGNASSLVAGGLSSGVVAIANGHGYVNGSDDATLSGTGDNTAAAFIGALNPAGAATDFLDGTIAALVTGNGTLTAGQISALIARMNALP